ncbi:MAG: peptide deformylase, partial [Chloroflexi bacterium]|nr:peptide deformylase [Chloroflexota bacterium]
IVIINPEWVKKGGERQVDEGCLSIPGYRGKLTRSEWVKVKGIDLDGRPVRLKGEGLLAHALEHEIDHLDGVLYIDRMKEQDTLDTLTQIDPEESVEVAAD